jgi:hypothetical protein
MSTAAAGGAAAQPASPQPQPAPGQPTVLVDPVAESIGKLDSFHAHTRREAAITLGKYGDARAVPQLIHKLEHDFDKEVRMACAWALAEIGDPRAIVPLETARQFDKRADVRAVATKSLDRMPREVPASHSVTTPAPAQTQAKGQQRGQWQQARDAESAYGYPTQRTPVANPAPSGPITSTPADAEPLPRYTPSDDIPPPDPTPSTRPSPGPR